MAACIGPALSKFSPRVGDGATYPSASKKNLNPFPSSTELLSSSLASFWGLTPGNSGLLQCEEGLQPPASMVEDVLGLEGVILQDGVHLQELGVVPTMLLDHLYKGNRLLGAARQLGAKFKNSWHFYFFQNFKYDVQRHRKGNFLGILFWWHDFIGLGGADKTLVEWKGPGI